MTQAEFDAMAISEIDFGNALMHMIRDTMVDALADSSNPIELVDLEGLDPSNTLQAVAIAQDFNTKRKYARMELLEEITRYFDEGAIMRRKALSKIRALKK
jgi:hypothetical protein